MEITAVLEGGLVRLHASDAERLERLRARLGLWSSEEGRMWITGCHYEDSEEGRALLAAHALLYNPLRVAVGATGPVGATGAVGITGVASPGTFGYTAP